MSLPPLQPHLTFPADVLERAQNIRVVLFDVDGVLTDGGLYFGETGESLKRFHSLDGHGIKLLGRAGITPAVVTGRDSPALRMRLQALGVTHVRYGTEDKQPAAESILHALGLDWHQAAAMGDDWPDLAMLRPCALAVAPAHAHTEVLHIAHYITQRSGGYGAVRELCDLLLMATGHYTALLQVSSTD